MYTNPLEGTKKICAGGETGIHAVLRRLCPKGVQVQVLSRAPVIGRLAQLVRAFGSHPRGHWFESSIAQFERYEEFIPAS